MKIAMRIFSYVLTEFLGLVAGFIVKVFGFRASLIYQMIRDARKPKTDRKSTRLNSSHVKISYAVFCLKKKKKKKRKLRKELARQEDAGGVAAVEAKSIAGAYHEHRNTGRDTTA